KSFITGVTPPAVSTSRSAVVGDAGVANCVLSQPSKPWACSAGISLGVAPKVAWARKRAASRAVGGGGGSGGGGGGGVKVCEPVASWKKPLISPLGYCAVWRFR